MNRRQKAVLVAIVLFVGLGLAWQFRKRDGVPSLAAHDGQPAGEWLAAATPSGAVRPVGFPQSKILDSVSPPLAAPPSASSIPARQTLSDPTVPQLSTAFTGRPESSPHEPGARVDATAADPLGYTSTRAFGDQSLAEATHKLADGDTLPALAEHYLGAAARWREIYEYNRDILTSPDLLPIGGELRIPSGRRPSRETGVGLAASSAERSREQSIAASPSALGATAIPVSQSLAPRGGAENFQNPARSDQNPPIAPRTNLVPVVEGTAATAGDALVDYRLPPVVDPAAPPSGAPVAKILRVAPGVYQVKPGDTLASIAQRLYGDSRQQQLLIKANRDRLHQSTEVRPGMTLIVPLARQ